MYQILFEPQATEDLIEILAYYFEQVGSELADDILLRLQSQIDSLQTMPQRCQNYPRLPKLKQFVIQNLPYKVYFLIDETAKNVQIVRILHTSRNHDNLI